MNSEKLTVPQMGAWLLAAMAAPVCRLSAGENWFTTALTVSAGCLLCAALLWGNDQLPGWLIVPVCLSLTLTGAWQARMIADCWQTERVNESIALTVILLAACGAGKGAVRAGRACAVLFWLLALLFSAIIGAGVKGIKPAWTAPEVRLPQVGLLSVAAIPAMLHLLPGEKGKLRPWLAAAMVFAVCVSAVTVGTLSQKIASEDRFPFYRCCRGLTLLGAAKRLESLAATGITLSWFCILCMIFSAIYTQMSRIHQKAASCSVWTAAALCGILQIIPIREAFWNKAAWAPLLWLFLPMAAQVCASAKKYKKRQNTT